MKRNTLFIILSLICACVCAQTVVIERMPSLVETSSAVAQYTNYFGKYKNPDVDIEFPYTVIRMDLLGETADVEAAKMKITLDMGTMYRVQDVVKTEPNRILFLIPKGVKNIILQCGDGCMPQTLYQGTMRLNKIYACQVRYTAAKKADNNASDSLMMQMQQQMAALTASVSQLQKKEELTKQQEEQQKREQELQQQQQEQQKREQEQLKREQEQLRREQELQRQQEELQKQREALQLQQQQQELQKRQQELQKQQQELQKQQTPSYSTYTSSTYSPYSSSPYSTYSSSSSGSSGTSGTSDSSGSSGTSGSSGSTGSSSASAYCGIELGVISGNYTCKSTATTVASGKINNSDGLGLRLGVNLHVDFMDGPHLPSMITGLHYQYTTKLGMWSENGYENDKSTFESIVSSERGSDAAYKDDYTDHMMLIPLRFQYGYGFGIGSIYLFTGPQFIFHLAKKSEFEGTYTISNKKYGVTCTEDYISGKHVKTTWEEGVSKVENVPLSKGDRNPFFDVSWGIGGGFSISQFIVNISYDFGLMNTLSPNEKVSYHNQVAYHQNMFVFTLGWVFGRDSYY